MEKEPDKEWTAKELGEAIQVLTLVMQGHDTALERIINIIANAGLLDINTTKH
jgi:hypothetical protein